MATVTRSPNGSIMLTPHFHLSELTHSESAVRRGIDNSPDPLAVANLFKLAQMMEKVRELLGGKAIIVSSGYRSVALNAAVKGSKTSDHMTGSACDFTCPGFGTPRQIAHAIASSGIEFGQLILEFDSWVHISLPNRGAKNGQVLTAKSAGGKAIYTPGL